MTAPKWVGYVDYHQIEALVGIKKGDIVTIPKGSRIRSTHPDPEKKERVSGRTYKVKVHRVSCGMTDERYGTMNPSIVWAGEGGYWCEVDVNDVPECTPPKPEEKKT